MSTKKKLHVNYLKRIEYTQKANDKNCDKSGRFNKVKSIFLLSPYANPFISNSTPSKSLSQFELLASYIRNIYLLFF